MERDTQAAALSPWPILVGAVLGITLATILGVAAGRALGTWINPQYLRIGGGLLFIAFGVLMLIDKMPG